MPKFAHKSPRLRFYGRIHSLLAELGISDDIYRDILRQQFGVESKGKLSDRQLLQLVQHLESLTTPAPARKQPGKYPNRPRNMDKGGSRADQLGKIEALLTIGQLPWRYADAIAKQMRLADKIAWVKTDDLFRVITALRKKAQKEGWDLSGETK